MTFKRMTPARCIPALSLLVMASFVLGGCEDTRNEIKQALGIDKQEIDESQVLTGPPLTLPPDYDLRPPEFGEAEAYASGPRATPVPANPYLAPGAGARQVPGQPQPYAAGQPQPYAAGQPQSYAAGQPQSYAAGQPPAGYAQPQGYVQGQPQYYDPNLAAIRNSMSRANQAYQTTNQYGAYQQPYAQPQGQQVAPQPYYGGGQPVQPQPYYGQQVAPQQPQPYYGGAEVPPAQRSAEASTLSTSEANPTECEKIITDSSGNYVCED